MVGNQKNNILLFTSQDIAIDVIDYFNSLSNINLKVILHFEAKEKLYGYRSALKFCEENNISFDLNVKFDQYFIENVKAFDPDFIFTFYYPRILPPVLLNLAPDRAFNVHPGILPKYRGQYSIPYAILNGEPKIFLTLHKLSDTVDGGAIIFEEPIYIDDKITSFQLYLKSMQVALKAIKNWFPKLRNGDYKEKQQVGFGSIYNRFQRNFHINWHEHCDVLLSRFRVHNYPYLPAYSFIGNFSLYVLAAEIVKEMPGQNNSPSDLVLLDKNKNIYVQAIDGMIKITKYDIYPPINHKDLDLLIESSKRLD